MNARSGSDGGGGSTGGDPRIGSEPFDLAFFEPYERLLLLSIMLEDVPESPEREAIVAVVRACFATVKQMQGRETRKDAYGAIERARVALMGLRRKP